MKLDELRQLAQAATPGKLLIYSEDENGSDVRLSRNLVAYIGAIPPDRILAMLDVIAAADAMREQAGPCGYCNDAGWYVVVRPNINTGEAEEIQEQCANCHTRTVFDAARAKLEE